MASFTIKRIAARKLGRDAMKRVTLHIDIIGMREGVFGIWQWRLRVGIVLIRAAAAVLRCGIKFTGCRPDEEE